MLTILIIALVVLVAAGVIGFAIHMISEGGLIEWIIGGGVLKITLELAGGIISALLHKD